MSLVHLSIQLDHLIDPDVIPPGVAGASPGILRAWLTETPDLLLWLLETGIVRASLYPIDEPA